MNAQVLVKFQKQAGTILNRVFSEGANASRKVYEDVHRDLRFRTFKNPKLATALKAMIAEEKIIRDTRNAHREAKASLLTLHRAEVEAMNLRHNKAMKNLEEAQEKIAGKLDKERIINIDAVVSTFGVQLCDAGYYSCDQAKLDADYDKTCDLIPIAVLVNGINSFKNKGLSKDEARQSINDHGIGGWTCVKLSAEMSRTIESDAKKLSAVEMDKFQKATDDLQEALMELWAAEDTDKLIEAIRNVNMKKHTLRNMATKVMGGRVFVDGTLSE